ncbi:MAG: hypothetical protein ACOVSR_13000 [Bacteroidia bacterium]
MKKNLLIILVLLGFVSCDNKLEINAPYREIPVIYGFININDTVQYLRIQKVFQNSIEVKANEASKISDSLELKNIKVQLIVVRAFTNDTINCYRTNEISKNAGFFANDKNFIYKSDVYNLKQYPDIQSVNLNVINLLTGNKYTAMCNLIGDQAIESRNITISENSANKFRFSYRINTSAFIIDAAIRLKYLEAPLSNPTAFEEKFYDYYVQSSDETAKYQPNSIVSFLIKSPDVLKDWRAYFETQSNNVIRQYVGVEYVTWGASADLLDIQEVSKPNISFVQKRTDYTNIKGGALGLFAARTINIQSAITVDNGGIAIIKALPQFQQ